MSDTKRNQRQSYPEHIGRAIVGGCFVFLAASTVTAQPLALGNRPNEPFNLAPARVNEAGSDTKARLQRATTQLADQQWEEAVAALLQIMEERGQQMIRMPNPDNEEFVHYVRVVDYGHWRLSSLEDPGREALRLYRRRVDPVVRPWYEQAIRDRDAGQLQRIVDRYFVSSYGDDALYALGEMALEQGDHTAARSNWERLGPSLRCPDGWPLPGANGGFPLWLALQNVDWDKQANRIEVSLRNPPVSLHWMAYPDTDLRLSDLRARLALVSILEGSPRRAQIELELLRRLHPGQTGRLGGRTVDYARTLTQLLDQSRQWPAPRLPEDWTTFAYRATRNGKAPAGPAVTNEPVWTLDLGGIMERPPGDSTPDTDQRRRVPDSQLGQFQPGAPSWHPLVVGDWLLANDSRSVHTVDIHTGQAEEMYPRGIELPRVEPDETPRLGSPCFTMTVRSQFLFARMGSPVTTYLPRESPPVEQGYLLGWDLKTKKLVLDDIRPDGIHWAFDGTPLVDDSNLYVAMRYTDIDPQAHVACYDIRSQQRRWRSKICSADTPAGGLAEELTHNLLTLDFGVIYFNTNLGAVAALGAHDGSVRWITCYPRSQASGRNQPGRRARAFHDPTPCIFHRGMLLVAPSDCDLVFALDAISGQLIWRTTLRDGDLDAVQLLGVAGEHLIACGRRLWWLDVTTGQLSRDVAENPYHGTQKTPATGLGRGVVAGDRVYWPARAASAEIHVINSHSGISVQEPIPLDWPDVTGVNLVLAKGYLFLTTCSKIYAFRGSRGLDQ